ncbi:MAG: hypothetical protein ACRENX_10310 [Candidatus Dormibacteria bacterium]
MNRKCMHIPCGVHARIWEWGESSSHTDRGRVEKVAAGAGHLALIAATATVRGMRPPLGSCGTPPTATDQITTDMLAHYLLSTDSCAHGGPGL